MKSAALVLRVLVRDEGVAWVAQALERDVVSQGATPEAALRSLGRVLLAHVQADILDGLVPLSQLPRAPEECFEEFRMMETLQVPQRLPVNAAEADYPEAWMIPALSRASQAPV